MMIQSRNINAHRHRPAGRPYHSPTVDAVLRPRAWWVSGFGAVVPTRRSEGRTDYFPLTKVDMPSIASLAECNAWAMAAWGAFAKC